MTDKPQTDNSQNDRTPDATDAGGSAGRLRPDQGGAPPGKDEAAPATGGEGAAGAGGSDGFGTGG